MPEASKSRSKRSPTSLRNALFGILVSVIAIWWLMASIQIDELLEEIRSVRPQFLAVALLLTVLSYLIRAWRWPHLFKFNPPSFNDSYRCLILGFFFNNLLPARLGELVRAHLGGRATKQSRSYVLATIAAERLADGLMISLLFALLFTLGATPEQVSQGSELYLVACGFAFATVATAFVLYKRHRAFAVLSFFESIFPGRFSRYTLLRMKRFIEGLEPIFHRSRVILLGLSTLVIWSVELSVYYFVALAFNQDLSLGSVSLFLAAVNFSSLIPAAPGGIGVIEAFATLALVQIGVDRESALAMVATQHLIQYTVVGLPGIVFFFLRRKQPLLEDDEEYEDEFAHEEFADEEPVEADPAAEFDLADLDGENSDIHLSIVIPAYNEEQRLPSTLVSVIEYCDSRPENFEVVVVDDGSTDGTSDVVRSFQERHPYVKLHVSPQNRGKGYTVRFGVFNAQGRHVLLNDADGASPIEEVARLEKAIAAGADVAIGSRSLPSEETKVEALAHRKFTGRIFSFVVRAVILPGISDSQCGFKLFTRRAAKLVFARAKAEGFAFDVEVLFLTRKLGMTIAEIPINWHEVDGSKIDLFRDSRRMFLDVVRFRIRDFFGGYDRPNS